MARHFIRSFIVAAALSPLVNAGPCRPSSTSEAVVITTTETSIATSSATTDIEESSLTDYLSGTPIETSLAISESQDITESTAAASTETTFATSKIETASNSVEQPTTTDSALSTVFTTTANESDTSTGTSQITTTDTGELSVGTTGVATTSADPTTTTAAASEPESGCDDITSNPYNAGGVEFSLSCQRGGSFNPIDFAHTESFASCLRLCAQQSNCGGVVFARSADNNCILSSAVDPIVDDSNYDFASRYGF